MARRGEDGGEKGTDKGADHDLLNLSIEQSFSTPLGHGRCLKGSISSLGWLQCAIHLYHSVPGGAG